jgi:hypothetical protein
VRASLQKIQFGYAAAIRAVNFNEFYIRGANNMENMNFERHTELLIASANARQESRSRLFPRSGDNSPSPVRRLYRNASRALTTSTRKDLRPGAPLTTRRAVKAPPSKVTTARLVRLVALRLSDPDKSFAWRSVSRQKAGRGCASLTLVGQACECSSALGRRHQGRFGFGEEVSPPPCLLLTRLEAL